MEKRILQAEGTCVGTVGSTGEGLRKQAPERGKKGASENKVALVTCDPIGVF